MSLYQKIKEERLQFRMSGDKVSATTLTTFVGELETMEKRGEIIDDAKVVRELRKNISTLEDMIQYLGDENSGKEKAEMALFSAYVPDNHLSEDDIERIVAESGAENIGQAMKHLIKNYPGQYDGKVARKVIMGALK